MIKSIFFYRLKNTMIYFLLDLFKALMCSKKNHKLGVKLLKFQSKSHGVLSSGILFLSSLLIVSLPVSAFAQSRDNIRITGSSTLYPFVTAVAEEFGRSTPYDAPIVEGIGTGGGMKIFCAGIGLEFPDIVNASRQIKRSELEYCVKNGVDEIIEIKVGYDGIVFANTKASARLNLSLQDIYLAIAKTIPIPGTEGGLGNMIPNPYTNWSQINPDLPDMPIVILGPPPTSGTRDTLNERALEIGCLNYAGIRALNKDDLGSFRRFCHSVREDGVFIESGENDNIIVQKLQTNFNAVGIFGFSFLDQNSDVLQAALIKKNGISIEPNFDTIADTRYPIYRALYFYAKRAHIGIIPGIADYIKTFTSEDTWGDYGYLVDRGLIPLRGLERQSFAKAASEMRLLDIQTILDQE